jgi:hypothetical protein
LERCKADADGVSTYSSARLVHGARALVHEPRGC